MAEAYCLGIDLGTTSVKVSLFDVANKQSVFSTSEKTRANMAGEKYESIQSVGFIMDALSHCVNRITEQKRSRVQTIAISAQMHGIVLWNSEDQEGSSSNLYTWQDQRANGEFLTDLPKPDSHIHLATGYGCVTLFWLSKNQPEILLKYNAVGTIADFLVTVLCGLDAPLMGHQMAASWGYFNTVTRSWNSEILKEAGFPVHLLPVVVESGSRVGELGRDWLSIQSGTTVLASLGDLQCAFLSSAERKTDAVFNMSTSCQLSYEVLCSGFIPPRSNTPTPVSHFPFFEDSYLAVAASMNGGNVIQSFVEMLREWLGAFEVNITDDSTIYLRLNQLANEKSSDTDESATLSILPVIHGERHSPELLGSVSGVSRTNTSLRSVFQSVCKGLVQNITLMMPCSQLLESGINRMCVSGSVVEKLAYVKECIEELYAPLEIHQGSGIDSAEGAGLVALRYMESLGK